ncbi:MAG: ABC transporter substrate-binding protein [Spirochaetia bacterium]|nr:ABC transporter substrate-binding protein [Spirochaetia bacterium]
MSCEKQETNLKSKNIYNFALRDRLETEDPTFSVDMTSGIILSLIHRNLYKSNSSGLIIYDLVEKETIENSNLLLSIKKNISFQYGCEEKLTAEDAEFSLNRLIDTKRQTWVIKDIQSFNKSNDYILKITPDLTDGISFQKWYKEKWPDVKARLTLSQAAVYSKKCFINKNKFASASGFFIKENNPQYINIAYKSTDFQIIYSILPDEAGRWFYFKRELLDVYQPEGIFRDFLYDTSKYEKSDIPQLVVFYGAFTMPKNKDSILNDVEFRRALNFRLNRKALTQKTLLGAYKDADYPVPDLLAKPLAEMYVYNSSYKYQNKTDEVIYIYSPSDRERQMTGQVLRSVIEKMGIRAELKIYDFPTILRFNNERKPGIYLLKWVADYPHASNFLTPLFHSKNAGSMGNRSYFKDVKTDDLLDKLWEGEENIKRAQIEIQKQAPWVFIGFANQRFLMNKKKKVKIPVTYTAWDKESFFLE